MNSGRFVVCEGLDASGKTTTINYAVSQLKEQGFQVMYNRALKTNNIFGRISQRFPSTLTLLIELLYIDYKIVRSSLKNGTTIIQDRWYYTIFSHNPENKIDRLMEKIFVPLLTKPDVYVHFTVSNDERIKRLKEKENTLEHQILLEYPNVIDEKESRYLRCYDKFSGEKGIVDTTTESVKTCANKLVDMIKLH